MSVQLPNGSIIAIASGYGAAKAMSALTNGSSPVATLLYDQLLYVSGFSTIGDCSFWPKTDADASTTKRKGKNRFISKSSTKDYLLRCPNSTE